MNIWENTVLTDKGKILQGKLLKGQTLNIKRVTTGAKKVSVVDLRQQTDVTEGGYDITLQPARTAGEQTIIPVLLDNKGLRESYELWQVGFYAEDPDEGEILFCLAQAAQSKHIPSETDSPGFSITWDFYFNTSNTAPFEVLLSSAGLVNIEAYEAHTEAIHKVNARINSINLDLESSKVQFVSKYDYSIGQPIEITPSQKARLALVFYTWNNHNSFVYTPMISTIHANATSFILKAVFKFDGTRITTGIIDIQIIMLPI